MIKGAPLNTAALAGEQTSFACISDTSVTLQWEIPETSTQHRVILVSDCRVIQEVAGQYGVDNSTFGRCDLVVLSASVDKTQPYLCSEVHGYDVDKYSAQLVVISKRASWIKPCLLK